MHQRQLVRAATLAIVWVAAACAAPAARTAPFRERPDSVRPGDLRGPFEGKVVDAGTDRPIAGAVVYATWSYVDGVGLTAPGGVEEHVATTAGDGRYVVPRLSERATTDASRRLAHFRLVIYKKGYVAYRSDRRFEDFGTRTDFAQHAHEVRLIRWRSDLSHVRHLAYVGGGPTLSAATAWELPEAAAELRGRPEAPVGEGTEVATAAPPVRAVELIDPARVKTITGFEGSFVVQPLTDLPTTADYDSIHLRAEGRTEDYDVALRLWILDPERATEHYDGVIADLPNATARDEVGDRSVRVASENGDILGVVFIDEKRGAVVMLTCGASQCRTFDTVVALARTVKERIDTLMGRAR